MTKVFKYFSILLVSRSVR